jgi:polygalacturonase
MHPIVLKYQAILLNMNVGIMHTVSLSLLLLYASALMGWLGHVGCSHSLDDYGGIRDVATPSAAAANGLALFKAISAAASGANGSRVATVPKGGNFFFVPYLPIVNISDVVLLLEGTLSAFTEGLDDAWPGCRLGHHTCQSVLFFDSCHNITVEGKGLIDGRGYDWWCHVIANHTDRRPDLIGMDYCTSVIIRGITLINSPQFHIFINVRAPPPHPPPPPPHPCFSARAVFDSLPGAECAN